MPVTLQFEKAGKVQLTLDVQGVGAQAPRRRPFRRPHDEEVAAMSGVCRGLLMLGALALGLAPAAAADDSFFTHLHTDKAMANVTVSPARRPRRNRHSA